MTKRDRAQIVENAIAIKTAAYDMGNVYIMMCNDYVPGVETLRELILEVQ